MTFRPKFPLPKGYFGTVTLSPKEQSECYSLVKDAVEDALAQEGEFNHVYKRQVDVHNWRQVKQKQALQIFRRRKAATKGQATMLGVGHVQGSLEDVLYGWYDTCYEDAQTTMPFITESVIDATVLHTIEEATIVDPFHYMGLKWMLSKNAMSRARDWCYIEAMGMARDQQGRRYGYLVRRSIDVSNCPPFHSNGVIRSKAAFSFILRERIDNAVDVFSYGFFDAPEEVFEQISTTATAEILGSVYRAMSCGEAKKLTVLARQNARDLTRQPVLAFEDNCTVCHKKSNVFASLKTCRICTVPICSACHIKKWTFLGRQHTTRKVTCCPSCIHATKNLQVRPADSEFALFGSHRDAQKQVADEDAESPLSRERKGTDETESSDDDDLDQSYWQSARSCVSIDIIDDDEIKRIMEESQAMGSRPRLETIPQTHKATNTTKSSQNRSLFHQLCELHDQSKKVSAITRENNRIMRKIC